MSAGPPRVSSRIAFRPLRSSDRDRLLEIAAETWEGQDYLPHVFDRWVRDPQAPFLGMLFDDRLIGCCRLLPLDRQRAYLESLRIDTAYRGRGFGRVLSRHIIQTGRDMGFAELLFATYFGNRQSIRISKSYGFRCAATFTNLDLDLTMLATAPSPPGRPQEVTVTPGLPDVTGMLWNDWLFLPPRIAGRTRFLPRAVTVCDGEATLVLAENCKYPGRILDICWTQKIVGDAGRSCLLYAIRRARQQGFAGLHVMLPTGEPTEPFYDLGFAYFEQEDDVYLYTARAAQLRLP
jgi:GNAT superfamily N-acetyltransferase